MPKPAIALALTFLSLGCASTDPRMIAQQRYSDCIAEKRAPVGCEAEREAYEREATREWIVIPRGIRPIFQRR
jgi:hypothetical protein